MIDFNCFIGTWPFYKVKGTFDEIKNLHQKNSIEYGYISSLNSIFYNDFYEAEEDLYKTIKDSNYKQVVTINPMLDGCQNTLLRCIDEFDVAGIRIFPGFHNYSLDSECLLPIIEIAKKHKLPIFLTLRMDDERMFYMFAPNTVPMDSVMEFVTKNSDVNILLCNVRIPEILLKKEELEKCPNVFFDTSGFKDARFGINKLENLCERVVYGSLAPVFCLKSTALVVDVDVDDKDVRKKIKSGEEFLKLIK